MVYVVGLGPEARTCNPQKCSIEKSEAWVWIYIDDGFIKHRDEVFGFSFEYSYVLYGRQTERDHKFKYSRIEF